MTGRTTTTGRRLRAGRILATALGAAALCLPGAALAQSFPADPLSLGAIADGTSASTAGSWGAPRLVTFAASGVQNQLTDVSVTMTIAHTWVGDLDVVLIAPDGLIAHTLFSRTGATSASSFGASSNLGGTYTFSDKAPTPPFGGWWQAAAAVTTDAIVQVGSYWATAPGPIAAPAPASTITPPFAGVAPNGVWTLRLRDGAQPDTGTITAATLHLTAKDTIPPQTTITKKPKARTTKRSATFGFKSSEAGSRFQCKLDKKAWQACSPPRTYTNLALGQHTFRVRAKDRAGNVDPTPAAFTWRIVRG